MRRFSAEYLTRTRDGMWEDSTAALSALSLGDRDRILDVGCGTGELTQTLSVEATAQQTTPPLVVGVDADRSLLDVAQRQTDGQYVQGDAFRLPFATDSFDLVVCQALLINLPDPQVAVEEFARVSSDLVAAIEPNNAQVGVTSTVREEAELEQTVRDAFLRGVETDVALGDTVQTLFEQVGLRNRSTTRYHHKKRIEPPYSAAALADAKAKATGSGLQKHDLEIKSGLAASESNMAYDTLRSKWRSMGRDVINQMQTEEYRRIEIVPFDVTVGRVL